MRLIRKVLDWLVWLFGFRFNAIYVTFRRLPMNINATEKIVITFRDVLGNPATVSQILIVASDPTVLVVPAIDPSAFLSSVDVAVMKVGDCTLTASGVNPDGIPVTGVAQFAVIGLDATIVTFDVVPA